jgi:hypothetical protein
MKKDVFAPRWISRQASGGVIFFLRMLLIVF